MEHEAHLSGAGQARSAIEAMLKDKFAPKAESRSPIPAKEATMAPTSSNCAGSSRVFAVRTPSKSPSKSSTKSPSKSRSLSDSTPKLSPSPKIKENLKGSKDDNHMISTPKPPKRLELAGGLHLQMPSRDGVGIQTPYFASRVPLSPQIDKSDTFGSPAKVLPRHSRGLDFSRACTNLHHSTLAEQSSPDSSPTVTQKAMVIPQRKLSINSMMLDPPSLQPWSSNNSEKGGIASSLGSVNMLGSDESSSESEECDPMDPDEVDDVMITTPQVQKGSTVAAATPFATLAGPNIPSSGWPNVFSPGAGASKFSSYHRARLRSGRSRKSSSSASGHSSLASPIPASPPAGKNGDGYFSKDAPMRKPSSRRESLSLGTSDLHISSGNDSGDEAVLPMTPGVVRRPVTRRGNLLPKTRAFGRIRAELLEESMPVDAEIKKEAEVIRQVRESDVEIDRRQSATTHSSPTIQPVIESLERIPEHSAAGLDNNSLGGAKGLFGTFGRHASVGGGREFWVNFNNETRTPPPTFFTRGSSSTVSDDVNMDSPTVSTPSNSVVPTATAQTEAHPTASRASTPTVPPATAAPPSAADGLRKQNKRRRDDDLDMLSMKRRAVSPGVSVQNSPILSQSPSQRGDLWGQPASKPNRESTNGTNGPATVDRSNSNGSVSGSMTPSLGPKRVGMQGMNDMQGLTEKMSIE